MLNGGKFSAFLKNSLRAEATNTTTLLKNYTIISKGDVSPFQHIFGKGKRSILFSVQKFGEMCITIYGDNSHQTELVNRATPGIWVGFAEGHPIDTYHVYLLCVQFLQTLAGEQYKK